MHHYSDPYNLARDWQRQLLREANQRRLAELVERRQRRQTLRNRLTGLLRRRRTVRPAPEQLPVRQSNPVGCAV